MDRNVLNLINLEYERRRNESARKLENRMAEAYAGVPGLEDLDRQIRLTGIRQTRRILLGPAGGAGAQIGQTVQAGQVSASGAKVPGSSVAGTEAPGSSAAGTHGAGPGTEQRAMRRAEQRADQESERSEQGADLLSLEFSEELSVLTEKKEKLLKEAGYPPGFLLPSYYCPICRDTGFIDTGSGMQRCSCYNQLLIRLTYRESNLDLTAVENFGCFNEALYPDIVNESRYGIAVSPRENIRHIRERCLRFIENFDSPDERNLYFCGPTGTGKTFMAHCIIAALLEKGRTVLYQPAPRLFKTMSEYRYRSFREDDAGESGSRSIFEADLLVIDDLGTEPQSSARYSELLEILDTRQANQLRRPCRTLISTNIGVKELYDYYDERIASRIIGNFDKYRFSGEDLRSPRKPAR